MRVETARDWWRRSRDGRGASGTSGAPAGTSGGAGAARPGFRIAYGLLSVAVLGVCGINALSQLREHERLGRDLAIWQPFVWEASSAALMIALAPLVYALLRRFPFAAGRWVKAAVIHAAATLGFSAVHIAGMVMLRKLAYALAGERYVFGMLPADLLYEYRKDAATYVAFAGGFWVVGRLVALERAVAARRETPRPDASLPGKLALRDGTTTLQVEIPAILWVASAGNYVELALADGDKKLIRGTLRHFESALVPHGFARVHRTRIVNLARVVSMNAGESGDQVLHLDDGSQIPASRRYREWLKPLRPDA